MACALHMWLLFLTAPLALAERGPDSLADVSCVTQSVNDSGGLSLLQKRTFTGTRPRLGHVMPSLTQNGSRVAKGPLTPKRLQFATLLKSNTTPRHSALNAMGIPALTLPNDTLFDTGNNAAAWHGAWISPPVLLMNLRIRLSEIISSIAGGTTSSHWQPYGFQSGLSRVGGLLLELHLPALSMEGIHNGLYASLADFLLQLRKALSNTAGVALEHINIFGIHERLQLPSSSHTNQWQAKQTQLVQGVRMMGNRELIVQFAVTSRNASDLDPQAAVDTLRSAIGNPTSKLMSGPLGAALQNSTITLSLSSDLATTPIDQQKESLTQMSALALPIGISAAFAGILVWLAA